jgi:hypothetical protein
LLIIECEALKSIEAVSLEDFKVNLFLTLSQVGMVESEGNLELQFPNCFRTSTKENCSATSKSLIGLVTASFFLIVPAPPLASASLSHSV